MSSEVDVERYDLVNGEEDIDHVIAKHFPKYASKAREIKHNAVYANITAVPTSAIVVVRSGNKVEIDLHEMDEKGFDRICGKFKLKKGENGSLLVFKRDFDAEEWKPVYRVKPS